MDKKSARAYGRAARAALSPEQRKVKSRQIFLQLLSRLEEAETIGCYVSMRDEAETEDILNWCLANGKRTAVPVTKDKTLEFRYLTSLDSLVPAAFGVREPVDGELCDPADVDLMIVPLSAFDEKGNRTGYGRGYYDSILSHCRHKTGIAFAEQRVDEIETDPWDVCLDEVISA